MSFSSSSAIRSRSCSPPRSQKKSRARSRSPRPAFWEPSLAHHHHHHHHDEQRKKKVDFDQVLDYRDSYRQGHSHQHHHRREHQNHDRREHDHQKDHHPPPPKEKEQSVKKEDVFSLVEQQKKKDPTAKVRWMCNQFKSAIIFDAVKGGMKVLDLCCGSGGDLRKFSSRCISLYYGVDCSEKSLEEAQRRCYASQMYTFPGKENTHFYKLNLDDPTIDFKQLFDVVSIQMALAHLDLKTILPLVSKSLVEGGVFICTLFDSRHLPQAGITDHPFAEFVPIFADVQEKKDQKNEKDQKDQKEKKTMTHYKYRFRGLYPTLVTESVIDRNGFMSLCNEHGLVMEKEYRFDEIMESRIKHRKTGQAFPALDVHDQQILDLYCGYIFRKSTSTVQAGSGSGSSSASASSSSSAPAPAVVVAVPETQKPKRVSSCSMSVQVKSRSFLHSI